ncbi:MAG: methyltransferase domain-containing protein [Bacteroidetes bacterium]|nr:methyltransferase domain-containing protein [Bacteroidota bacterium]
MNRIEEKVFELVKSDFADKKIRILELAPGEGGLTQALIDDGYSNVEALDINPQRFEAKGVKCHKGNLNEPMPFESGSFDLVISVEGIEHLENQYQFASELNRVLKENAHAIITTPNIINFASRIRFIMTGFYALAVRPSSEFEKNWVIEHIYPLTSWQLRHILHTNGLFIRQIETDHIRKSSMIGLLFYPFAYLLTWKSLAKEGDIRQREKNKEILKQIHTPAIYLGRTQIILAQKQKSSYIKAT